ncbi:hypothetical protein [Streptomyces sp. NPDC018000]|uniref:hypothetical protein n=1 Tax=Streptomyces sp. NPDC018000 TaxID=3365028 RepID=UPI00378C697B
MKITTQPVLALLGTSLLLAATAGCAVDSPPQHSERLQKAAGLKTFQIDTIKELWEKTSEQTPYNQTDRSIKAEVTPLSNGLSSESIRMYDEISAALDRATKRPGPDEPPPRIVVDTAYLDAKPSRTSGD